MEAMTGLRVPVPVASTQGTLALALLPRSEPPPPTRPPRPAAIVPIERRLRASIEEWARRFAQAAVEIVGGDRPVSQLLRWTAPDVYADLHRRALLVGRAGGHQPGLARVQPLRPQVRSVHTCFVRHDVVEAAVHVRYGQRSRALAVRFERRDQRWICTALDFS